jgi:hypothetical protein
MSNIILKALLRGLCEIALAEVGYIEQPVNVTKYGQRFRS